jgi:SM-20-related protein
MTTTTAATMNNPALVSSNSQLDLWPPPRPPAKATPASIMTQVSRAVVVVDNVLREPQRAALFAFLQEPGWKFGWKSSRKRDLFSFWHKHFAGHRNARNEEPYACADELLRNAPLVFELWLNLSQSVFRGHTLMRAYANAHAYGGDGTLHTDSKKPNARTAVYYPHAAWLPDWGGETVLFNDDQTDIITSIYPKPNRLVSFPGCMPHVARGVSRSCPELRIALAFKTIKEERE